MDHLLLYILHHNTTPTVVYLVAYHINSHIPHLHSTSTSTQLNADSLGSTRHRHSTRPATNTSSNPTHLHLSSSIVHLYYLVNSSKAHSSEPKPKPDVNSFGPARILSSVNQHQTTRSILRSDDGYYIYQLGDLPGESSFLNKCLLHWVEVEVVGEWGWE